MLKIYAKDCGWRGSILVVAESKESAFEMMKDTYNFDRNSKPEDLEEIEIAPGVIWVDLGDT